MKASLSVTDVRRPWRNLPRCFRSLRAPGLAVLLSIVSRQAAAQEPARRPPAAPTAAPRPPAPNVAPSPPLPGAAPLSTPGAAPAAPGVARPPAPATKPDVASRGPAPSIDVWAPQWRRFGLWDYVGTAVTLGGFYAVESMSSPSKSHWDKPLPLDRPFRDFIAADTRKGRALGDDLSDVFWYASVAYPVATSLVVPPLRGKGGAAMTWQLTMMNLEAFAVVSLLTRLPHKLIGRRRPNGIGCAEDPNYSEQCDSPGQLVSFWGGHTAVSMTGAGLSCAHHLNGHLFGSVAADVAACGAAVAAGQAVSFFRLRADKHWVSDNMLGTLVGFGVGFGMPTFLHYRPFWRSKPVEPAPPSAAPPVRVTFMPVLSPQGAGASLGGMF